MVAAAAGRGTQQAQQAQQAAFAGASEASSSSGNRFAKFTLVGDATPLWVAEAQRLAQHAAQVGALVHTCVAPHVSVSAVARHATKTSFPCHAALPRLLPVPALTTPELLLLLLPMLPAAGDS